MKNAIIRGVSLGTYDDASHGMLTGWLELDYGGEQQDFGGYRLDQEDAAARWIQGVMRIADVTRLANVVGKPIRVTLDSAGRVYRVIHFLKDDVSFCPREEFGPVKSYE